MYIAWSSIFSNTVGNLCVICDSSWCGRAHVFNLLFAPLHFRILRDRSLLRMSDTDWGKREGVSVGSGGGGGLEREKLEIFSSS